MIFHKDFAAYLDGQRGELEALAKQGLPDVGVIRAVLKPDETQNRAEHPGSYSVTEPVDALMVDNEGITGDRHRAMTRPATAREAKLYARTQVPIVNRRQVFAVSPAECEALSMSVGVEITPGLLGANLVVDRDDGGDQPFFLSDLPSNTYLVVGEARAPEPAKPPLATLIHYVRQKGCKLTGEAIATRYDDPSLKRRFIECSRSRRGILCSV